MLRDAGRTATSVLEELMNSGRGESPFPPTLVDAVVKSVHRELGEASMPLPHDRPCAIRLRLLRSVLHAAGDPDAEAMLRYIEGVPIGVGIKMPRTPAVHERRRRWSIAEQVHPDAPMEPGKSDDSAARRRNGAPIARSRRTRQSHPLG